jgi:cell wall-associated NlpC family hydrolase
VLKTSKYKWAVQHLCPWRKAVALTMAVLTAGAWIPFSALDARDSREDDEEFEFVVPPPVYETHAPLSWVEKAVPRPPVSLVKHPKPPATTTPHPHPHPTQSVSPTPVADRPISILLSFLRAQLGDEYEYGGDGPDEWDCSGLTVAAYAKLGVYLPRTSELQSLRGHHVSLNALQVGDLLFWGAGPGLAYHVAIYVGGGHFIGAQNPSTGVVQLSLVNDHPDFARRIL